MFTKALLFQQGFFVGGNIWTHPACRATLCAKRRLGAKLRAYGPLYISYNLCYYYKAFDPMGRICCAGKSE